MLRRTLVLKQELPSGEPLRRSAQLLANAQLREPYLEVIRMLMAFRFKQHPWLGKRFENLTETVSESNASIR